MSFLDTMREILETEGLLRHDTQKARPLSSSVSPPMLPQTAESARPVPVPGVLQPGCVIHWQAMNGKTYGPVVVEEVTQFEGRTWVFVQYEGADRLLSELLITVVEPGESGHESAP